MGWVSWASRPPRPLSCFVPATLVSYCLHALPPVPSSSLFPLPGTILPGYLHFLLPHYFRPLLQCHLLGDPSLTTLYGKMYIQMHTHLSLANYPALFLRAIISTCQFICVFIYIFLSQKKCDLPESRDIVF